MKDSFQNRKHLSTFEVSTRLNMPYKTVREFCRYRVFKGAFQLYENGPWSIPLEAIEEFERQHRPPYKISFIQKVRFGLFFTFIGRILVTLTAILGLFFGAVSASADFRAFVTSMYESGIIQTIRPANNQETLILVFKFYHSEGVADVEAHNKIKDAIDEMIFRLGIANLRVEIYPKPLSIYDYQDAVEIGQKLNAKIVVWGADTGVDIRVRFLNIGNPDFNLADVAIFENQAVQMAYNGDLYVKFINSHLPTHVKALAFFAVAQSYSNAPLLYSLGEKPHTNEEINQLVINNQIAVKISTEILKEAALENMDASELAIIYNYVAKTEPFIPYDQALNAYNMAIELDPNNEIYYSNRGILQRNEGNYEQAIQDFSHAIELKGDESYYYSFRGDSYFELEKFDLAIADCNKALSLSSPNSEQAAHAYYVRARARHEIGDYAGAIDDYSQTIEIKPEIAYIVRFYRSGSYLHVGNDDAALEDLNYVIPIWSNVPDASKIFLQLRGEILFRKGRYDEAVADFTKAIGIDPTDAELFFGRGRLYLLLEDFSNSEKDFRKAIDLGYEDGLAYHELALSQAMLGKFDDARLTITTYLSLHPDSELKAKFEELLNVIEASQP